VRPSGATHSAAPLVTDADDGSKNILAISLAEYEAPEGWEYTLDTSNHQSATVKVNAGWTQLQLYQKIRPLGYFLPTQSAGPVFQLGGMVANCVHGGNTARGFLHQYVLSMRVMLHDGTIKVIDNENDLKFWRNSYGLLGVIIGIEFSLERRLAFQQSWKTYDSTPWTENDFWTALKTQGHLDIPSAAVNLGKNGDRKALMNQFFFDPYEILKTGQLKMNGVVWRVNENVTVTQATKVPSEQTYASKINERTFDEFITSSRQDGRIHTHQYTGYNEAVRHWGGPVVLPIGFNTNDIVAPHAELMTSLTMGGPKMLIDGNSNSMNDGFYAYLAPKVLFAAYFLPLENLFKALDFLVKSFKESQSSDFAWNGPPELRFITVKDDAVLNPVPAGVWAVAEYIYFPLRGKSDEGWKSAFKSVQDEWIKLGGKPHLGKFWGFGTDSQGKAQPFQPAEACKIYSNSQKTSFNNYRRQMDPDGLFAAGPVMNLLALCDDILV
jgi:hypothetical protein